MPARRADVRRGPAGSREVSFLTFFFGAEGFVDDALFSGFGPMLMVDNPISLYQVRGEFWRIALEQFLVLFYICETLSFVFIVIGYICFDHIDMY